MTCHNRTLPSRQVMFIFLFVIGAMCAYCDSPPSGNSDSGVDGGIDSGADTESSDVSEICPDYPEPHNTLSSGAVVRNYVYFDLADERHELCELRQEGHKLALLIISPVVTP